MNIVQVIVAYLVVALLIISTVTGFEISWYTIDGSGGTSTNGTLNLSGTIGQPDASPAMTGVRFRSLVDIGPVQLYQFALAT